MEVKGTSLKSTNDFVKENFPDRYDEWLNELPAESRKLFKEVIMITEWYPSLEGLIIPTRIAAKLFYNDNISLTAFEMGRYSAKVGLTGIYNIFIKIASPTFILKKASTMFNTYYSKTNFEVIESNNKMAKMLISGMNKDEAIVFDRTEGWIHQLGVIINTKFDITKKVEINDNRAQCIILAKW